MPTTVIQFAPLRGAVLLALLLCALSMPAGADVLAVPAHYPNVQAAVDAASDGDIVLLAPIHHAGTVVVDGTGLSLVSDGPQASISRLVVRNLLATQRVVLRGVKIDATSGAAVTAINNLGSLHIEDCELTGAAGTVGTIAQAGTNEVLGSAALLAQNNAQVVLNNSVLSGGHGGDLANEATDWLPTEAGPGLFLRSSKVVCFGGELRGGQGGSVLDAASASGEVGAPGAQNHADGLLELHGTLLVGGDGGDGNCSEGGSCGGGGQGGAALLQTGAAALSLLRDVTTVPGAGGFSSEGSQSASGLPLDIQSGSSLDLLATHRGFQVGSPVRSGEHISFSITGEPGDRALLFASFAHADVFLPGREGSFLLAPPFVLSGVLLPPIPASGALELSSQAPLPDLGPGIDGFDLRVQAAFDTGAAVLVGPLSVSTLLRS